jgi:hypothetical protein
MSNIYIGWCDGNGFQLVPLDQATFPSVEGAQKSADQLNAIERERGSDDEWFVLVGDRVCQKPCVDCDPESELHHWLYDATDEDEAEEGEDAYPDGRMNCKHCETWRTVVDSDE